MIASSSSPETFSALQVAKFKMLILLWLSTFLVMHMSELKCVKRTKLIFAFIYTSCLMEIVSTFYLKGMLFQFWLCNNLLKQTCFSFSEVCKDSFNKAISFSIPFFSSDIEFNLSCNMFRSFSADEIFSSKTERLLSRSFFSCSILSSLLFNSWETKQKCN